MKRILKHFFSILFFGMLLFQISFAQENKVIIKSTITDQDGNPVSNATISWENGVAKTYSGINGEFTIDIFPTDIITIDADDFEPYTVAVSELISERNIILVEQGSNMNELVNIPFGKIENSLIVGSSNYLNADKIGQYNDNQNVLEAISGLVPGFYDNRMRGAKDYLIVVDNIPRASVGQGSDFDFISNLSMSEIDQITFLKDATAAAMFGSKAKDGVLLITTKRGVDQKNMTNLRIETGLSTPKAYPSYLGAADYMTMYNRALVNDGGLPKYSLGQIDSTRLGLDPVRYPNEEFYNSDYLNNFANFFRISADASGGNEKTLYYSNLSWKRSKDLYSLEQDNKSFTNNQLTFRGNVQYGINDWLTASLDAFVLFGADRQPISDFWSDASTHLPNAYPMLIPVSLLSDSGMATAARLIDGSYVLGGTNQYQNNIYGNFVLGGSQTLISRTSQINFGLDFDLSKITKGLSAKTYLAYDILNNYTVSYDNDYAVYERSYVPNMAGTADSLVVSKIGIDKVNQTQNLSDNSPGERRFGFYSTLDYRRIFYDKHAINASVVGYWNEISILNKFYPDKQNHFGLRGNYIFDNRLVAQLSTVFTGSSYLPEDNRYRLAPSMGLSWILSEESFLSDNDFIDYLKLNISYGTIYTDMSIPDYYIYKTSYQSDGGFKYNNGLSANNPRVYSNFGNPDIGLLSKKDFNFGFDGLFLDKRLFVEFDYFISILDGGVVKRNSYYPAYVSVLPYENYNKNKDQGFDLGLRFKKKTGDLSYQLGVNISYIVPKAVTVEEPDYTLTPWRSLEGQAYDAIFGYVAEGLFADSADIAGHASQNALGNVTPGDIKYQDLNNDGEINEEDQRIIGNSKSRLYYGVNLLFKYKNFSLFALGTGQSGGNAIFNNAYYWQSGQTSKYSEVVLNSWTKETAETATYPALHLNSADNNFIKSTYWIEENNWFSLQTLQLSYHFSSQQVSFGKGFKVYLKGNNLMTFSPIKDKLDLKIGKAPSMASYSIGVDMVF